VLAIALAVGASACWGAADFLGGLFSRRISVIVVLFVIEVSGLVVVGAVVLATGEDPPGGREALAALAAGAAGISALGAFYRALAIGTMSIVAPISASGVTLPVVVGLATGDAPSALAATGLAVTVAGVMLASRESEHPGSPHPPASRAAIGLALLAAVGFGTFFITYDVASDGSVLWAMLLARSVALPFVGALVLARRPARPVPRDLWALAGAGMLDLSAVTLYALANRAGELSIVAVVGSLYPVVTVLLARAVLHERIAPLQAAGVAAALAGVALVAAG
jgi:drug/metabolite transporter (DMT)-like permease